MSRPRERGTSGAETTPLTATRRMYRAGTGTALAIQAAGGRAALAASRIAARNQLAWLGATTGAASDAARRTADAEIDAVEAIAATAGRTTEETAEAAGRTRGSVEATREAAGEVVETSAETTAEAVEAAERTTTEVVEATERATAEVVEATGEVTAGVADAYAPSGSAFDRFLDAAAPFGHRPADDGG